MKEAALTELEGLLNKSKEAISRKYSSLRKSYIRERTKEKGSKTSGAGADSVCASQWKFMKEIGFLEDEIKGDESTDNITFKLPTPNKKSRRKSQEMSEDVKMELWKSALAALKTPEPSAQMYCTHLSDPDEQWLLSLSPQLKGLTPQQKSLARLKIQTEMEFCSGSSDAMYFWTLLKYVLCIE